MVGGGEEVERVDGGDDVVRLTGVQQGKSVTA